MRNMNTPISSVGSQVYVQVASDIAAQLQNLAPTSNNIADVHICGTCKHSFSDIRLFVDHKPGCSAAAQKIPSTMAPSLPQTTLGYLTTVAAPGNEDGISTLGQPFLGVILEGGNLTMPQAGNNSQQDMTNEETREPQILRSRLLGISTEQQVAVTVQQPNFRASNGEMQALVMQQQQHSRREFHIDEEDVATLLANHLSSETINSSSRTDLLGLENEIIIPGSRDGLDLGTINLSGNDAGPLVSECEVKNQTRDNKLRGRSSSTNNSMSVTSPTPRDLVESEDKFWSQTNVKFVSSGDVQDKVQSTSTLSSSENAATVTNNAAVCPSRGKKRHDCPLNNCNFTTSYLKDLVRHMRKHTGERPFQCDSCQRSFSRGDKLQMHLRIHSGEKPHRCQQCDYATIDSGSLRKHMRIHNDERPYKCQICPYRSRDTSQLTVHLRTHTGDNPFVCPYENCPSAFKTSSDLKRHARMHTGEKPFSCDLCSYKCAIKSNLRVHVRLNHIEAKPISCNSCDHVSTSKRAAKEHEKSHAEEVLKCAFCSYSCINAAGMRSHLKVHTQDKPFSCKHCSYTCRQQGNLKSHIRKKHPDSRAPKKTKGATKETTTAVKGNTSVRSGTKTAIHSKPFCVKSHQCTFCNAAFVREDSWRSHMRQHQTQESPAANVEEQTSNAVEILSQAAAEVGAACDKEREVAMMTNGIADSQEDILGSDALITLNSGESPLQQSKFASETNRENSYQVETANKDNNTNAYLPSTVRDKSGKEHLVQQLNQQEIVDSSNLQAQPVFLYVQNTSVVDSLIDDSLHNAEILASLNQTGPIFLTGRCGQYLSVPVEQSNSFMEHLAATLQPGMQCVLSGPLENIVGSDATFIQAAPDSSASTAADTSIPVQSIISVHMDKTTTVDGKH